MYSIIVLCHPTTEGALSDIQCWRMFFLAQNVITLYSFFWYISVTRPDPERGQPGQVGAPSSEPFVFQIRHHANTFVSQHRTRNSKITNSCLTFKTKQRDIFSVFGETGWGNMCSMQYLKLHCSRPITNCCFLALSQMSSHISSVITTPGSLSQITPSIRAPRFERSLRPA